MTAEEAAQFAAFKAEKAKKEAAEKAKNDRETYSKMVNEEVTAAIPVLQELSKVTFKISILLWNRTRNIRR